MKQIGIIGTAMGEAFGVGVQYLEWANQFGNVHILMPHEGMREDIDLVILQGGADVAPERYGKAPWFDLSRSNPYLEHFDKNILPAYIEAKVPIFGICRGLQTLNVHFGGTLRNLIQHATSRASNRADLAHSAQVVKHSRWYKPFKEPFEVNSLHHQAIDVIGENIDVVAHNYIAKHGEGTIIEAIEHETLPIAAVQYHPEEIYDTFSRSMVLDLLDNKEGK